jgi:uncharacterized protein
LERKHFDIKELEKSAKNAESSIQQFFKRLKKKPPKNLDSQVQQLHNEVFSDINCLDCANCCRSLGPQIKYADIERASRHLKISTSAFIEKYLKIDEDHDYIFKNMPCPFLGEDNYCSIYVSRPRACAEYPHTNRKRIHQLFDLTIKNMFICPAVFEIVRKLKENFK